MATVEERCRRAAETGRYASIGRSRTPISPDVRELLYEASVAIKNAYRFAGECMAMAHGEAMTITVTATRNPQKPRS